MKVVVDNQAAKYLSRLNEPIRGRIKEGLKKLREEPPEGDIRKLQGQEEAFRLRIGDYRILFKKKKTCIAIYKIAPRGQAYKKEE